MLGMEAGIKEPFLMMAPLEVVEKMMNVKLIHYHKAGLLFLEPLKKAEH